MRFIKTEFQNVLSFGGNITNTIEYSASSLSQVFGDNGVGKTNFTKLIEIGVYFEYPETVGDILNRNSSEGFIVHEIESNGEIWEIKSVFRKGLKSLVVKKGGEVCDWGNPSSVQKKILEYIVTVPFTVFKNILCSSMDNVSSVLKMNAKESRDITNQIFDLNDINLVGEFTSKYHYNKNKLRGEKQSEIDAHEVSLKSQEEVFEKHKEENKKEDAEKLDTLKTQKKENDDKMADELRKLEAFEEEKIHHEYFIDKGLLDVSMAERTRLFSDKFDLEKDISELETKKKILSKNKLVSDINFIKPLIADDKKLALSIEEGLSEKNKELKISTEAKNNLRLKTIYFEYLANVKQVNELNANLDILKNEGINLSNLLVDADAHINNHENFEKYFIAFKDIYDVLMDTINVDKPELERLLEKRKTHEKISDHNNSLLTNLTDDVNILAPEIAFLKNPMCPLQGCGRVFTDPEYATKLKEKELEMDMLKSKIKEKKELIDKAGKSIVELDTSVLDLRHKISVNTAKIKSFEFSEEYIYKGSLKENFDIVAYKETFSVSNIEEHRENRERLSIDLDKNISDKGVVESSLVKLNNINSVILMEVESNSLSIEEISKSETILNTPDDVQFASVPAIQLSIDELTKNRTEVGNRLAVQEDRLLSMEKTLKDDFSDVIEDIDVSMENLEEIIKMIKQSSSYMVNVANEIAVIDSKIAKSSEDISAKYGHLSKLIIPASGYDEICNSIKDNKERIDTIKSNSIVLDADIIKMESDDSDKKYKLFEDSIKAQKDNIKKASDEWLEINNDFKSAEILKELYNSGWLKNELIGKVVGGINKIMVDISEKYDIAVRCEFDSGFNARFFKDGIETKYGLCSLGQRKMMQLTAIIAIVAYYKQIYRDVNFIFLDEALSSLTEANANKMIGVVKEYLIQEMDMAVFISHHSYLKNTYFDGVYSLKDKKSYTTIEIVKEK